MSCLNSSLLEVIDSKNFRITDFERYEKFGFKFSKDKNRGYRFASKDSRHIELEKLDSWRLMKTIEIPCGCCLQCRIDYAKNWAVRCVFESKLYQHNYFVTLSIDDDHLEYGPTGNPTLKEDAISCFMKALRQYYKRNFDHVGIRFLGCGEYNSSGGRSLNPHYHLILFNCPIPDLTINFPTPSGGIIHKYNSFNLPMMFSSIINKLWNKGFIAIDDANFNTESYVSKYIMKKQKSKENEFYKNLGVVTPYLRMSNRPAIGFNYFLQHEEEFLKDFTVIVPKAGKPLITSLPKIFKRKLFDKYPKIRAVSEHNAKVTEDDARRRRFFNNTTSNQQKAAKQTHLEALQSVHDRNY